MALDGGAVVGRGWVLSSTVSALSSNKTNLEVIVALESREFGAVMRSRCASILILCTSLDSQRRAVIKWGKKLKLSGYSQLHRSHCV